MYTHRDTDTYPTISLAASASGGRTRRARAQGRAL